MASGGRITECFKCKKKIESIPFNCKYCGKFFCGDCRLPENHECKKFEEEMKKREESWKTNVTEIFRNDSDSSGGIEIVHNPPPNKVIVTRIPRRHSKPKPKKFEFSKLIPWIIIFIVLLLLLLRNLH